MDTAYVRRFIFSLCAFSLLIFLAGGAEGQTIFSSTAWQNPECGGSALGDFDNDGWPDVFRTECRGTRVALMHNEGDGKFADRTGDIQTAMPDKLLGYGQTFADYDNDGDLDLFVAFGNWNYSQRDRNLLLRNDRGVFTDVAQEAGLTDVNATDNAVWLDYDRDGWLDLYTANLGQPEVRNLLYRNNGDGTFADVTAEAGLDVSFSEEAGGSNGALAAGDFNDDGWPDLYVAVFRARNRLFLNDGQGRFVEITSEDLGDPGQAFDVAVGDFDNDGDLDLFQATGGLSQEDRSLVLLNLGEGEFLDVTEAVGISVVGDAQDTGFGDIDDDGDLDLTLGQPRTVFRNDGGIFVDITDQAYSGDFAPPVAFWDYDLDGHLDGQGYRARFLNNGNGFHTLQVELVGIESNRNGIGARLIATTGELEQMREILGGRGFNQDEMVAHFGLGERAMVDRLEIRWPSGQVDVLTDIPADRKIRVFEGHEGYYPVKPSVWEAILPDSLVAGAVFQGTVAVHPALFEPGAEITRVVADLSQVGGPEEVELTAAGDGVYRLEAILKIPEVHGLKSISVMVDQSTSLGPHWTRLSRELLVLPDADHAIFAGEQGGDWMDASVGDSDVDLIGFLSFLDNLPEIHLADVEGKRQVKLTHTPGPFVAPFSYFVYSHNWDWSPDGMQLVVSGDFDGEGRAIWVTDVYGRNPVKLTNPLESGYDEQPSWSPDGSKIAYSANYGGPADIVVMSVDGSDPVRLTDSSSENGQPSWSPDGTKIVFTSARDGNYEIYAMNADGSDPVRLTDNSVLDGEPSWSPDGSSILFNSMRENGGVMVMNADGSDPVTVGPGGWTPCWSPDGKRIAYSEHVGGPVIVVIDADGNNRVVVSGRMGDFMPRWFPGTGSPVVELNLDDPPVSREGKKGLELSADRAWTATFASTAPPDPIGYASLGFAFHPGAAELPEGGWLHIRVNNRLVDLLGEVDVSRREWQEVVIPLEAFALDGPVERIEFSGFLQGTFYLGDIRLVTAASGLVATAVTEEWTEGLPRGFALEQNFPNPFNSGTMIRFALPISGVVELSVYNLAGQKVTTLVEGMRVAGLYEIAWDGRDDRGRSLASGVYLYRLQAGERVSSRTLVLLK
jgi:enediyne biosynthesis protein E4